MAVLATQHGAYYLKHPEAGLDVENYSRTFCMQRRSNLLLDSHIGGGRWPQNLPEIRASHDLASAGVDARGV